VVAEVVRRDVDRLKRGDRVAAGRRDALLEHAHLVGEGRLVPHSGRHAAEKGRHLGAGLGEAEDVVDEEEHVLLLDVTEVLRHGEGRQGHAQAGARRLVHLAEDERGLVDDAGLGHLEEEVIALTGALAHSSEDRDAAEVLGHAVDHLLDEDGLAHACTAEEADLAALDVGGEQVDDLDAGGEDLGLGLELVEGRSGAVNAPALLDVERGLVDVERLAEGVPHVTLGDLAHGHRDGAAGVAHRRTADEAVGGLHGDGAHHVVADVLGHLEGEHARAAALLALVEGDVHVEGVEELRHRLDREFHVDDGAGDAGDASDTGCLRVGGRRVHRGGHVVPLSFGSSGR